jgi:hypothetical protein
LKGICLRSTSPGATVLAYLCRVTQGANASVDLELAAVRRAFDAAYRRMVECSRPEELPDELSNMLHHVYRLSELRKRRWKAASQSFTKSEFIARVGQVNGALGAIWIRAFDTHEIATVADIGSRYPDVYTAIYGVLVWREPAAMPFLTMPTELARFEDYRTHLSNRVVLVTLRKAFDGLSSLS